MNAKSGWILREVALNLTVNRILPVLIVSNLSLRLCVFAFKTYREVDCSHFLVRFQRNDAKRDLTQSGLVDLQFWIYCKIVFRKAEPDFLP